jgi:rhodanese-related sulfurtransferase
MVETINKEEIKAKLDAGEPFVLLDVRDTPDYREERIKGAVHLLIADMDEERVRELARPDDLVVVYSLDSDCPAKFIAAERLQGFGFTDVRAYPGSWREWKEAGLPTES